MSNDTESGMQKTLVASVYERFGKWVFGIVQAGLITAMIAIGSWAYNLDRKITLMEVKQTTMEVKQSADIAAIKESQLKMSDLKEVVVEIKATIKESLEPIKERDTDHEARLRALERERLK
jgi:uncharacterized membrane protein